MTEDATLTSLRDELEGLDARLVALLASRRDTGRRLAALEQAGGLPARDVERERAILARRLEQASALGVPAALVESVFRQLLVESRELRKELTEAVRAAVAPREVAIIGAHGGMGRLFTTLFESLGHRVLAVDKATPLTAREAAAVADVVVVTVPIRETERVVAEVGPCIRREAMLVDLTSLKAAPMRAMLDATAPSGASVVGLHPMFGPGVHTFEGQRVVVCPGRGDAALDWILSTLSAAGLAVTVTDAERHDRAMALVQVLTHYQTQVLGLTLARFGSPIEEPLAFTSPAYLLELYVTARHFAQDAALYGPIEMLNPETERVTRTFLAAAREVADVLARQDQPAFDAIFSEVSTFFGAFTAEALDQSGFLIDRLVELTTGRTESPAASGARSTK